MQAERPAYSKVICLYSWPLDVRLDAVDALVDARDVAVAATATATTTAAAAAAAAAAATACKVNYKYFCLLVQNEIYAHCCARTFSWCD